MAPAKDTEKETGNVFIYIDNSNLWIQGQRTYAEKYNQDADRDPRWRFDAGILMDVLLRNSDLSTDEKTFTPKGRLYGSTPPIVDSVWRAIGKHNIKVRTFARSSWTKREKEVDAEIIADSVFEASEAYFKEIPAVFIIVSGDRDVRSAVVKITGMGFPVHIWSWKNGIAKAFTREDEDIKSALFRVQYLDPYLEVVGFARTTFRVDRGVINPHSIVVLDPMSKVSAVEGFLKQLRTPVWRYEISDQREGESNALAIIPTLAWAMKSDDLLSLFMESKTELEKKGLRVLSYQEYTQKYSLGSGTESALAISNQFSELGEHVEGDDKKDGDDEEESDEERGQQGEDNRNENQHGGKQNVAGTGNKQKLYDDEGFEEVNKRLQRQRSRLRKGEDTLQIRCRWREYCERGSNCKFGHTKEEEESFRVYGIKKAKKYKLCTRDGCLRGAKCQYAHGLAELFCPTCGKTGAHSMDSCPERSSSLSLSARQIYGR